MTMVVDLRRNRPTKEAGKEKHDDEKQFGNNIAMTTRGQGSKFCPRVGTPQEKKDEVIRMRASEFRWCHGKK
jgi:hypothetical protein